MFPLSLCNPINFKLVIIGKKRKMFFPSNFPWHYQWLTLFAEETKVAKEFVKLLCQLIQRSKWYVCVRVCACLLSIGNFCLCFSFASSQRLFTTCECAEKYQKYTWYLYFLKNPFLFNMRNEKICKVECSKWRIHFTF